MTLNRQTEQNTVDPGNPGTAQARMLAEITSLPLAPGTALSIVVYPDGSTREMTQEEIAQQAEEFARLSNP